MASTTRDTSEISDEDDLPLAWSKVIVALETEAHFKLDSQRAPTIAEITQVINPAKTETDTKKIRNAFAKALRCIDRIGSIIAPAAGAAFPMSNQVYNAVSFLIQVSKDTQEVFENLAKLMDMLSVFLERLSLYIDNQKAEVKLEKNLRTSVYRVLEQFVTIMALSYKLTRTWKKEDSGWKNRAEAWKEKTKVFVKVGAFGDDSGIRDAIAAFQRLVSQITDVQIDEIHRGVGEVSQALGEVGREVHAANIAIQQLQGDEDDKKMEMLVRKALGIAEDEIEDHLRAHEEFQNQIPGTGDWLFERYDLRQWKEVRTFGDTRSRILRLIGPEGYGKSYLAHTIINQLHYDARNSPPNQVRRVAWYYISRKSKDTSVNQAFRHIIFQLARLDKAYMKFLHTAAGGYTAGDAENTMKLWNQLVAAYSEKQPKTTFFIVMDGVDHAEDPDENSLGLVIERITKMSNDAEGLRVRLLVTGLRGTLEGLQGQRAQQLPTIDLLPSSNVFFDDLKQREDVSLFAENRLKNMDMFRGELTAERSGLKTKVLKRLTSGTRGNYKQLEKKLREIADSDNLMQVEDVLKRVDEDQADAISRQIVTLNQRLEGESIRQLNEIFTWVATARTRPNAELLRSVLTITFGSYALYDPVEYAKKNCPELLNFSKDGEVSFLSSDVITLLQAAPATRATVPEAQIDLIQAMLQTNFRNTFGSYDVYDKFGFEEFFRQKRNVQTDLIYLGPDADNNLRVLDCCLQAICDLHGSEQHQALRNYANYYIQDHLLGADSSTASDEVKKRIGPRLYRAITDPSVIRVWASTEMVANMERWFEEGDKFCDQLIGWMADPVVQQSVRTLTTDTDWLSKVTSTHTQKHTILQHFARNLLQRWYDDAANEYMTVWTWLRVYFHRTSEWAATYKASTPDDHVSATEMKRWESWARKELPQESGSAQWYVCMANTYHRVGLWLGRFDRESHYDVAQRCCDEAVRLDAAKWQARIFKASLLFSMDEYEACLRQVEITTAAHASLLETDAKYATAYWDDMMWDKGRCLVARKEYEAAAGCYRQILDHVVRKDDVPFNFGYLVSKLVRTLLSHGNHTGALDLLRELGTNGEGAKNTLRILFVSRDATGEVKDLVPTIADRTGSFTDVDAYYTKSIEHSKGLDSADQEIVLLELHRWKLRWRCGPVDRRELIIARWEGLMDGTSSMQSADLWSTTKYDLVLTLAHAYYTMARQHDLSSPKAKDYIDRLRFLVKDSDDVIAFFRERDPTPLLARLYHLAGEDAPARELLRPEVRRATKLIRDPPGDSAGYVLLGGILGALDDDDNARAAWSLIEPKRRAAAPPPDNDIVPPALPAAEGDASPDPATPSSHLENPSDHAAGTATEAPDPISSSTDNPSTPSLSGNRAWDDDVISLWCTGRCGAYWTKADDIWVCKECVAVYLDGDCYRDLKAGKLLAAVCSSEHEHLHVPAFDVEAWLARDPGQMIVGSKTVERSDWLREIEREWELDEWVKTTRAIALVQRYWLRRKRRRERRAQMAGVEFTGVTRTQTI